MAERISGPTLVCCVQAVHAYIRQLERERADEPEESAAADLDNLLLCFHKAALELKEVYAEERGVVANLPEYRALVPEAEDPWGEPPA